MLPETLTMEQRDAVGAAIEKIALASVQHSDLKWSHVGRYRDGM